MVSYDYAAGQPVALPAATRELLERVRRYEGQIRVRSRV